jgi:hypothetical protein
MFTTIILVFLKHLNYCGFQSFDFDRTWWKVFSGTNNLSAEISIHPKHWLLTGDTAGTNSPPFIGMEHKMLIQNEEFKLLSVMSTYIILNLNYCGFKSFDFDRTWWKVF